jgi:hypothetical protein
MQIKVINYIGKDKKEMQHIVEDFHHLNSLYVSGIIHVYFINNVQV